MGSFSIKNTMSIRKMKKKKNKGMIDGDRALCTFVGALPSLHALASYLSMVGGLPHRRRPPPQVQASPVVLPRTCALHHHRCGYRLLHAGFVWWVAGLHWIPGIYVSWHRCGLHLIGHWIWVVWACDPPGARELGCGWWGHVVGRR